MSVEFNKIFTASNEEYPLDQFSVSSTSSLLTSEQEEVPDDLVEEYSGVFSNPIHVLMASVVVKKIIQKGSFAVLTMNTSNEEFFVEMFRNDLK